MRKNVLQQARQETKAAAVPMQFYRARPTPVRP